MNSVDQLIYDTDLLAIEEEATPCPDLINCAQLGVENQQMCIHRVPSRDSAFEEDIDLSPACLKSCRASIPEDMELSWRSRRDSGIGSQASSSVAGTSIKRRDQHSQSNPRIQWSLTEEKQTKSEEEQNKKPPRHCFSFMKHLFGKGIKSCNRINAKNDSKREDVAKPRVKFIIGQEQIEEDIQSSKPDIFDITTDHVLIATNHGVNSIIESLKTIHIQGMTSKANTLIGKRVNVESLNFVAAYLNNRGGKLIIPSTGVSLYVPPGALLSSRPQLVYAYITDLQNSNNTTKLEMAQTLLTPTVECGPSGLQFAKDVFLTMPHCAVDHTQWEFTAQRGKEISDSGWETLQEGADTLIFSKEKHVTLAINHFTPYRVYGKSSSSDSTGVSKWMKVAVFPVFDTNTEEGDTKGFRVRLFNQEDWQTILREEGLAIEDEKVIPSQSLPVIDESDTDVIMRICETNNGWKIAGDFEKRISHEHIWSKYQEAVASGELTFTFQLIPGTSHASTFPIQDSQLGSSALCKVEICQGEEKIAELNPESALYRQLAHRRRRHLAYVQKLNINDKFLAQQKDLDPGPESLHFMDDSIYRRLCTVLDSSENIQRGWKMFAVAQGIDDVHLLDSIVLRARCKQRSPSAILLDFFFSESQEFLVVDTLRRLSNTFLNIQNHEAKRLIDEVIYKLVNHDSSNRQDLQDSGYFARHDLAEKRSNDAACKPRKSSRIPKFLRKIHQRIWRKKSVSSARAKEDVCRPSLVSYTSTSESSTELHQVMPARYDGASREGIGREESRESDSTACTEVVNVPVRKPGYIRGSDGVVLRHNECPIGRRLKQNNRRSADSGIHSTPPSRKRDSQSFHEDEYEIDEYIELYEHDEDPMKETISGSTEPHESDRLVDNDPNKVFRSSIPVRIERDSRQRHNRREDSGIGSMISTSDLCRESDSTACTEVVNVPVRKPGYIRGSDGVVLRQNECPIGRRLKQNNRRSADSGILSTPPSPMPESQSFHNIKDECEINDCIRFYEQDLSYENPMVARKELLSGTTEAHESDPLVDNDLNKVFRSSIPVRIETDSRQRHKRREDSGIGSMISTGDLCLQSEAEELTQEYDQY